MTSSFSAVGCGHKPHTASFTEVYWTDITAPGVAAYPKSKTIAERAAWNFIAHGSDKLELTVVNPVGATEPFPPAHASSSARSTFAT
jgi:hypothetical protein